MAPPGDDATRDAGPACAADACGRAVHARGHCSRHYRQLLRHGEVRPEPVVAPCAVPTCARRAVTRGWCHGHYLRWSRQGDVRADDPLAAAKRGVCSVDDCEQVRHARGLCRTHLNRLDVWGEIRPQRPVRSPGDEGWITHGYRGIVVPEHLRHLVGGAKHATEHRVVMAVLLGRPLTDREVVHHRNGDRLDNRPQNLELWSTTQPKGQRISEKLEWAYALIATYDPDGAWGRGRRDREPGGED